MYDLMYIAWTALKFKIDSIFEHDCFFCMHVAFYPWNFNWMLKIYVCKFGRYSIAFFLSFNPTISLALLKSPLNALNAFILTNSINNLVMRWNAELIDSTQLEIVATCILHTLDHQIAKGHSFILFLHTVLWWFNFLTFFGYTSYRDDSSSLWLRIINYVSWLFARLNYEARNCVRKYTAN